jgi:hypothetical protein
MSEIGIESAERGDELDPKAAAAYLGELLDREPYQVKTIYNLHSAGELLPNRKISNRLRFTRAELRRWAERQIKVGGSFAAARKRAAT